MHSASLPQATTTPTGSAAHHRARYTGRRRDNAGMPDLECHVSEPGLRARYRIESAHLAFDFHCRLAPVDIGIALGYAWRVSGVLGILRARHGVRGQRLEQQFRAEHGQLVVQRAGRVLPRDRERILKQHRPGIEALVHLHDGDAGFDISREQRALDRRGATPAREQRSVHVDATARRQREQRGRQHQPISGHHQRFRTGRCDGALRIWILERGWLQQGEAAREREPFHRRMLGLQAATGRPVRLGQDERDFVPRVQARPPAKLQQTRACLRRRASSRPPRLEPGEIHNFATEE